MAQSANQLDANKNQFTEEQLRALDKLHDQNPEVVDLDAAVEIGLLTQEIRERIDKVLPGHMLYFQRAVGIERRVAPSKAAFKRTFEVVYGKFLFEQEFKELEKPDGELSSILGKILKFDFKGKKGRSSIEAMMRRLNEVVVNADAVEQNSAEIATLESEKMTVEGEHADKVSKVSTLNALKPTIGQLNFHSTPDGKKHLGKLADGQYLAGVLEGNFQYEQDELAPLEPKLEEYRELAERSLEKFGEFKTEYVKYNFDSPEISFFTAFELELETLLTTEVLSDQFDAVKWQQFIEQGLQSFIQSLKDLHEAEPGRFTEKVDLAMQEALGNLEDLFDKAGIVKQVADKRSSIEYYEDEISLNEDKFKQELSDYLDLLESQVPAIQAFKTPAHEALVPGLSARCDEYLQKLEQDFLPDFRSQITTSSDLVDLYATLQVFVEDEHKKFIAELELMVQQPLARLNQEVANLKRRLDDVNSKISTLKGYGDTEVGKKMAKDLQKAEQDLLEATSERDQAQSRVDIYDRLLSNVDSAKEAIDGLGDMLSGKTQLADLEEKVKALKEKLDEDKLKLEEAIAKIPELNGVDFDQILTMDHTSIELLRKKIGKIAFSRRLLGVPDEKTLTKKRLAYYQQRIDKKYPPNLDRYLIHDGTQVSAAQLRTLIDEASATLSQAIDDGKTNPVNDPVDGLIKARQAYKRSGTRLEKAQKQVDEFSGPTNLDKDAVFSMLDAFTVEITQVKDDPDCDDSIKNIANQFLTDYAAFDALHRGATDFDSASFKSFLEEKITPLLTELSRELKKAKKPYADELARAVKKVSDLAAKIDGLKGDSPLSWVLKKAFPGVNFKDGTVTIRGFETNFEHTAKQLDEAAQYFTSSENVSDINKRFGKLKVAVDEQEGDSFKETLRKIDVKPDAGIKTQISELEDAIRAQERKSTIRPPTSADIRKHIEDKKREWRSLPDPKDGFNEEKVTKLYIESTDKLIAEQEKAKKVEVSKYSTALRALKSSLKQAEEMYQMAEKMMGHLEIAHKAGIKLVGSNGVEIDLKAILDRFSKIDLESVDFKPKLLTDLYAEFNNFFETAKSVSGLIAELKKAKDDINESTNLQDNAATEKVFLSLISTQFPDMSLEDQQKLVKSVLAEDIEVIQTTKSYRELAERGGAELFDTINCAGFRQQLIGFKYKVGDTEHEPFKGLKPEDFMHWSSIEKLFDIGKLDHKNGFFALCALDVFAGSPRPLQNHHIEKRLKLEIAKELGADSRMNVESINRLVQEAFDDQYKKAMPFVTSFFTHYNMNAPKLENYLVKRFNTEYEVLAEKHKRGEIDDEEFYMGVEDLLEKAKDAGVVDRLDFPQHTILNMLWTGKEAQWIRDRLHDLKNFGKDLTKRTAAGIAKLTAKGALGTLKAGGEVVSKSVWQLALYSVWRIPIKYPAMILGKLPVGFINLFRKQKWTPYSIQEDVRSDWDECKSSIGSLKEVPKKSFAGAVEGTKSVVAAEAAKLEGLKHTEYKDRSEVKLDELGQKVEKYEKESTLKAMEVVNSPFVDLDKYKERLKQIDDLLSGTKKAA